MTKQRAGSPLTPDVEELYRQAMVGLEFWRWVCGRWRWSAAGQSVTSLPAYQKTKSKATDPRSPELAETENPGNAPLVDAVNPLLRPGPLTVLTD